jgi:hypothetical protein
MGKDRKNTATPAAAPAAAAIVQEQAKTPVSKRGTSSVASPVAQVWVRSHNMCAAALAAGQPAPSRKQLVEANIEAGVAYHTARTQVQLYLKASEKGTKVPSKAPKGVSFGA